MFIYLYMTSFLDSFMGFLDYIGMVLSALLGILIADYFFIHKRKYNVEEFESVKGKHWYFKGVNLRAITVWVIGVVFFLVIRETDLIVNVVGAVYPTVLITTSLC